MLLTYHKYHVQHRIESRRIHDSVGSVPPSVLSGFRVTLHPFSVFCPEDINLISRLVSEEFFTWLQKYSSNGSWFVGSSTVEYSVGLSSIGWFFFYLEVRGRGTYDLKSYSICCQIAKMCEA